MTLSDEAFLQFGRSRILLISACSVCAITFGYFYLKKEQKRIKRLDIPKETVITPSDTQNISCVQQAIQKFEQKKESIPQKPKMKICDSQTCVFNYNDISSFITPEIEMKESLILLDQIRNNPHRLLEDKIVKIRLNNLINIYKTSNPMDKTKIIELLVQFSKYNSIRKHICIENLIEVLREEFSVNDKDIFKEFESTNSNGNCGTFILGNILQILGKLSEPKNEESQLNIKKLLELHSLELLLNYISKLEPNERGIPKPLTLARIQSFSILILSNLINFININMKSDEALKQVDMVQTLLNDKPIIRRPLMEHEFNTIEEFHLERMKHAKIYLEFIRHLLTAYISFDIRNSEAKAAKCSFQWYLTISDNFKKDLNNYLNIEPNYLFFNEIDKIHKLRQLIISNK